MRRWAQFEVEQVTQRGRSRGRAGSRRGAPAAIGFNAAVDAVSIGASPPSRFEVPDEVVRGIRAERFRAALDETPELDSYLNTFDRDRLAGAILASLTQAALGAQTDLESTYDAVGHEVLTEVGRILDGAGEGGDSRTSKRISEALDDPAVRSAVQRATHVFGEAPQDWHDWLTRRWTGTVAALVHRAIQDLCPEFDADEVVAEFDASDDGRVRIWLVETAIGGSGLLQAGAERLIDDPRGFVELVNAGMLPASQELVAAESGRCAGLLVGDDDVAEAVANVRTAREHSERERAFRLLLDVLANHGVFVCHPVVAAFSARFLRPGAGQHSDRLTYQLLEMWKNHETVLGIDLELAAFARLQSDNTEVDAIVAGHPPGDRARRWRVGQVQGLLWPRGAATRRTALSLSNRFTALPSTDPAIVASQRPTKGPPVAATDPEELFSENGRLAVEGEVVVRCSGNELDDLRRLLLEATVRPIDMNGLLDHARVRSVRRTADAIEVALTLDLAR